VVIVETDLLNHVSAPLDGTCACDILVAAVDNDVGADVVPVAVDKVELELE
jgi:hypothetical protein